MTEKKVKVINRLGMHARPSAMFVTHSSRFESVIFVEKVGQGARINGKSIMGVMMLAAEQGSQLLIIANGEDEEKAVDHLVELVKTGFGELKDL